MQGGRAPHVVEGRPWPLQRPASPTVSMPHTPQHSPNSQGPLGNAHAAKASIADPMQTDPPHQPSTSAPLPSQVLPPSCITVGDALALLSLLH